MEDDLSEPLDIVRSRRDVSDLWSLYQRAFSVAFSVLALGGSRGQSHWGSVDEFGGRLLGSHLVSRNIRLSYVFPEFLSQSARYGETCQKSKVDKPYCCYILHQSSTCGVFIMANETEYSAIIKALWVNSAIFSKQLDNSLGAIHGIGLTEYMVLLNLSQAPNKELRRIDIAEALARTASGITRMLMPMEKIGLVAKASSARDARVSLVKLTAAGERLFVDATITLEEKSKKLLKNLDGKNATHLLSLLDAL